MPHRTQDCRSPPPPFSPTPFSPPPPFIQISNYATPRIQGYPAEPYCPSDGDDVRSNDDRSTLLGSAPTSRNNSSATAHAAGHSYDTFPREPAPEPRKEASKTWRSIVELFVVLLFLTIILQPVISAFIRFVDPHDGIESRQHRLEHKKWEEERKQEDQRRADERASWAEEEKQMSERRKKRLEEWEEDRKTEMEIRRREKEEWNREREAELERQRKEKAEWEEMKKDMDSWRYRHSGAVWSVPVMGKCAAYGIRQYSAILSNVPTGLDLHRTCEFTSVTIQDREYDHPKWCDDQGHGELRGYWWVDGGDSGELGCKPYWNTINHLGCTGLGSGKRRFESSLRGLVRGESWERLCATAPATINGVHYDMPTNCDYRGGDTIWGIWDVDDEKC